MDDIGEDDIDILCLNIDITCNHIINILKNKYPLFNYAKYRTKCKKTHIDIFYKKKFIIKFDISNNIKKLYPKYNIPSNLTKKVIKNSKLNDKDCKIPTIEHELMIRQLEYDSYIEERPDKIKHLKFIEKYNIEYPRFSKKN